jgi:hypothetical protein
MNPYEHVREYAKTNAVDIDDGQYRVWTVRNSGDVTLCGDGDRRGFEQITEAFDWARQHARLTNVIITGPGGQFADLPDGDRYPAK